MADYQYLSQAGYATAVGTSVTGAQGNLTANSGFAPDAGACVVQSAVLAAASGGQVVRQVETGYARCNAATIDGSCSSGYRFVEVFNQATQWTCYQHAAFGVGASNAFAVSRPNGGAVATAYINGTPYEQQMGYGGGDGSKGALWMESTTPQAGHSCSGPWGPASGYFGNWQQGSFGSWIGGSTSKYYGSTIGNCWKVGDLDGSHGFAVSD